MSSIEINRKKTDLLKHPGKRKWERKEGVGGRERERERERDSVCACVFVCVTLLP